MIITLIGFMGSGKSTIGRKSAEILGWKFIDLDSAIEREYGPIKRIFSLHGESYFREKENLVLSRLLESEENAIIALGGGTVINQQNREILKQKSFPIWIKTPVALMLYEISLNKKRPIVRNKTQEEIIEIYNSRIPYYQECSRYTIEDVALNTIDQVATEIAAKIGLLCS